VLVVFDSFCGMSLLNEEHQIDPVRFPHFARLAETATWYRNATTVRPRTGTAVPAILTGSMPRSAYPPATESEYPHNLFRLLQDTGQYEFVIFESVGRMASPELNHEPPGDPGQPLSRVALVLPTLCAVYLHAVAPADLPLRLPGVPPEWYGLGRGQNARAIQGKGVFLNSWLDERDRQCERFVASLDHTSKPMLSFIHVCLPHYPWCFLPSGRRHQADLPYHQFPLGGFGANGEDWTDDELVVTHSWRAYLLQVGYADRFVGQLQDRLRELKVFDDCLLIVVADHGVAFLPGHSRREPDGTNLSEIMSIPLLIKYPRQHTRAIDDRNVESIDILPTIADVLELELPYSVDGSSILDDSTPPRARKTLVRDDGELIVVDPRFPSKYDSVARMIATFGSGVRGDRFWHAGSAPELIGRRIESFPIDPGPGPSIELDPTTGFEPEARRAEEIIPCSLSGRVTRFDHRSEPLILAVAVNGVIVGVTRTSTDPRISDRFAVIVPESAFSGPADERRLFAIRTDGDQTVLQPCPVTEDSDGM
jgi:hypothetical protein